MSTKPPSGATEPPRPIPTALRPLLFLGIPESVLRWKPRLPSRNMTIFLLTVGTISYLYYDDRRQCRKIRADYIERVRGMADAPMQPSEYPRKVTVYTAKYPGDDDYNAGATFFKRYVKPILVASAMDYEIISGTRHGGLARTLRDRIHDRRRVLAGVQSWDSETGGAPTTPFRLTPAQELQRELDGATVIVGRPAFKEWAWSLRSGWDTNIPQKEVDNDQELALKLADDSTFDEESTGEVAPMDTSNSPEEPLPVSSGLVLPTQIGVASLAGKAPVAPKPVQKPDPEAPPAPLLAAPDRIPAQAPLCYVEHVNLAGWRNWPRRIVHFFNHRHDAQIGADAALAIIFGNKREAREFDDGGGFTVPPQGGDLDWGLEQEQYYPPSFNSTLSTIAKERESFYKKLPDRLKTARELARGEREPTKEEKREPPASEVELREERFNKEKDWRDLEMGYEIIAPDHGVEWNQRWTPSVRVFRPRGAEEAVPRREDREVKPRSSAEKNAEEAAATA